MIIQNGIWTVYIHKFPNNKCYVGITSLAPKTRWKRGSGYTTQVVFKAIQKYGWDNIQHIIFATHLTEQEAKNIQQILIQKLDSYNNGYNSDLGGSGTLKYKEQIRLKALQLWNQEYHLSKIAQQLNIDLDTIKKWLLSFNISQDTLFQRTHFISQEYKNIIYNNFYIKCQSEKQISQQLNISQQTVGRILHSFNFSSADITSNSRSIPVKDKEKIKKYILQGKTIIELSSLYKVSKDTMSRYIKRSFPDLINYIQNNKIQQKQKPVKQFSLDGKYLNTFSSIKDAAKALNLNNSGQHIGAVCRGQRKTAYGFKWQFLDKIIGVDE